MSRYIDAEWLKKEIRKAFPSLYMRVEINTLVNLAPSIDIVFCRECKLGGTEDCPMDEIDDEYFCNFGEREGE